MILLPFGRGVFRLQAIGTPARRAGAPVRRGMRFDLLPFGLGVFRLQAIGTPARRAARWGRLWGCAPFAAPLASPPKHPQRKFSTSFRWRGHASYAAGASLSRYARSGDLPPRRVNAIPCFPFDQSPFQPTLIVSLRPKDFTKWKAPITRGICHFAFRRPSSEAGRGVAFLKLARAKRGRWLVLSEFAKYAFFWPDKEKSCF